MKAFEILSEPSKWTQRVYARDLDGNPMGVKSPSAVCFCADGAIRKAYIENGELLQLQLLKLRVHLRESGHVSIPGWNDAPNRTYEEVVETLRKLDI